MTKKDIRSKMIFLRSKQTLKDKNLIEKGMPGPKGTAGKKKMQDRES